MNAEKLVDGKELLRRSELKMKVEKRDFLTFSELKVVIGYCSLSPAELAEIMGGAMWVVEELKKRIAKDKAEAQDHPEYVEIISTYIFVETMIADLESQAPVSEIEKEIRENRRKAQAWKALRAWLQESPEKFDHPYMLSKMKKLLAEEE